MRRLALPTRLPRRPSRRGLAVAAAVAALVLGSLAAATAVLAVRIDGDSMAPTLRDGERVLLRPRSGREQPDRFAVVVGRFRAGGPLVVKRVIGLPGDRVAVVIGGGESRVKIQPGGQGAWSVVDNPAWDARGSLGAVSCCDPDGRATTQPEARLVPVGMLFLLGDNSAASEDSRALGWAPIDLLEGVVGWRVHPPGRVGGVGVTVGLRPPVDKAPPEDPP